MRLGDIRELFICDDMTVVSDHRIWRNDWLCGTPFFFKRAIQVQFAFDHIREDAGRWLELKIMHF